MSRKNRKRKQDTQETGLQMPGRYFTPATVKKYEQQIREDERRIVSAFYKAQRDYFYWAIFLLRRFDDIARFVTDPDRRPSSNVKFLNEGYTTADGERVSWSDIFKESIHQTLKALRAIDPDSDEPDTTGLINNSALLQDAIIRFEAATEAGDEKRQLAAIEDMKGIVADVPTKAIQRQIEMRADRDYGGAETNPTIDAICHWIKKSGFWTPDYTRHDIWDKAYAHFHEHGNYAQKKQFREWRHGDGIETLYRAMSRRYGAKNQ